MALFIRQTLRRERSMNWNFSPGSSIFAKSTIVSIVRSIQKLQGSGASTSPITKNLGLPQNLPKSSLTLLDGATKNHPPQKQFATHQRMSMMPRKDLNPSPLQEDLGPCFCSSQSHSNIPREIGTISLMCFTYFVNIPWP